MRIIYLQVILLCFAMFIVYSLFLHWKKKNVSNRLFFIWVGVWLIFIFFDFFPQVLEPLLRELFIVRVMDLAMIGTFMILTYITIENNIKIRNLENRIEKLVRRLAVKKISRNK